MKAIGGCPLFPASATKPGQSLSLDYDATGRLNSSTLNGSTTTFLYDGNELVAEYNASGTLLRRYVHGVGSDDPLVWYEGAGTTNPKYLLADERGSIMAETNAAGTVVQKHQYGPYGEPINQSESRFRYTGQILLPGTELYHYKARVYHPKLGRFLQTDPIGYKDGMNWYAYVGNDPMNMVDPDGTCGTRIKGKCSVNSSEYGVESNLTKSSYSDAFVNKWNERIGQITSAADDAVDYWIQRDNPVMGTLAATLTSSNIGNTTFQLTAGAAMAPLSGVSVIKNFASQFGQKLFLSETFGITSSRFANSVTGVTGSWNVTGNAYKMGWSTTSRNGGGMMFRLGLGSSGNTARFHFYAPGTFIPNSFANGSIQVKRALNNMGM